MLQESTYRILNDWIAYANKRYPDAMQIKGTHIRGKRKAAQKVRKIKRQRGLK